MDWLGRDTSHTVVGPAAILQTKAGDENCGFNLRSPFRLSLPLLCTHTPSVCLLHTCIPSSPGNTLFQLVAVYAAVGRARDFSTAVLRLRVFPAFSFSDWQRKRT